MASKIHWEQCLADLDEVESQLENIRKLALLEYRYRDSGGITDTFSPEIVVDGPPLSLEQEYEALRSSKVGQFTLDAIKKVSLLRDKVELTQSKFSNLMEHRTTYSPKVSASNKPLEVTFQTPSHIQDQGLSSITITIPPASVERLNNSIAAIWQHEQQHQQRHKLYQNDGTILSRNTLPTLQAIQCFMHHNFHLDITSFPLTRVSCNDIGIIGCDGRIKLFSLPFVDTVLKGIQDMVEGRYADVDTIE
jgi:hypothetical protein